MSDAVALLPAAGAATRLDGVMKELLPIVFRRSDRGLLPVPALVHALENVAAEGFDRAIVVVSPAKLELVRVLGDGSELGLRIAWVVQPRPSGLSDAVVRGLEWTGGRRAVLLLPDAVFEPRSALRRVADDDADVTLAIFPTDRPQELGPVETDGNRVVRVLEKPDRDCPPNTWGIMGMSPRFQTWLTGRVRSDPALGALSVGPHVNDAISTGLSTRAFRMQGHYRDLGTPHGLEDWVLGREP
ncbi:MAG: NTP transferase domain-containing protein [Alphaproteobacteria bacterium]|nr:NTP transferase domain-containing protein [Alphaproteobacteria bacterium]